MASIKVIAAGYEAELDIPDDDQVADWDRYAVMLTLAKADFHTIATDADLSTAEREDKLAAMSALLLAIQSARNSAVPAISLTLE